jgi:hypothetical protein
MSDDQHPAVPEPQGRFAGLPYDFRRPTAARARARFWNPSDRRILTPKTFGRGLDLNLYWIVHPHASSAPVASAADPAARVVAALDLRLSGGCGRRLERPG